MSNKCYITTVKDFPTVSALERIEYIMKKDAYGFGKKAPVLSKLDLGSKICFYLPAYKSIVLHAIVDSQIHEAYPPEHWKINDIYGIDYYNVEIKLTNIMDVNPPVKIPEVLEKLRLKKNYGNYVICTHEVDSDDFKILIGLK